MPLERPMTLTEKPCPASRSTTALPTAPVPPVINTRIKAPFRKSPPPKRTPSYLPHFQDQKWGRSLDSSPKIEFHFGEGWEGVPLWVALIMINGFTNAFEVADGEQAANGRVRGVVVVVAF